MTDKYTYKDLDIEDVINKYRDCKTTAGDDYFCDRIMNPFSDTEKDFLELVDYYNIKISNDSRFIPSGLNRIGKFKFSDFKTHVSEMTSRKSEENGFHYFIIAAILITFSLIFIYPGFGFLCFLVAVAVALFSYFSKSKDLAINFFVFKYIIRLLNGVDPSYLLDEDNVTVNRLVNEMKEIRSVFGSFLHGQFLIKVNESTEGNPIDVFLDYVRMIFHLDIIKYNRMHKILCENEDKIIRLYEIIGMFDVAILTNKIRINEKCCIVTYTDENRIYIKGGYHPLINNPVKNDVDTNKNILITGCNASGKSTFLKMVALNVIWAEAFGYTFAEECVIRRFDVLSSMAIKDSLKSGESYFTAELNSIKRIIATAKTGTPVLCIIDEILRGTNTVERIAASTEILKSLKDDNIICIAATHDIELTKLLDDAYINMHFSEEITQSDVCFSYKIIDGPSDTRNAIRLLSIMGYDDNIVENAEKRAASFIENGMWE